jgi:hypothetical protein
MLGRSGWGGTDQDSGGLGWWFGASCTSGMLDTCIRFFLPAILGARIHGAKERSSGAQKAQEGKLSNGPDCCGAYTYHREQRKWKVNVRYLLRTICRATYFGATHRLPRWGVGPQCFRGAKIILSDEGPQVFSGCIVYTFAF